MSRRLLAGAVIAPTVVVVGATAVFFDINQSGETLGQRLTQASMRVNQLRAELNGRAAPAPRIEIARAPDADRAAPAEEPRPAARVLAPNTPLAALSVEPVAEIPRQAAPQEIAAAPERQEPSAPATETVAPPSSEKLVVASLPPAQAPAAAAAAVVQPAPEPEPLIRETAPRAEILAPVIVEIPPAPVEPVPVIALAREELPAPVVKAETPAPIEPMPVIAVAREELPAPVTPMPVIAVVSEEIPAPAPAPEVTIAREEKPEAKTIFAGLGLGGTAMAATAPANVAAVPEPPAPAVNKPEPVQVASLDLKAVPTPNAAAPAVPATTDATPAELPEPSIDQAETEPEQMNMHLSAPLRMRALTRADLLSQEKLASLRSATQTDALPAEQQRVAYDEPALTEVPVSVGKRKWIDESRYKGLGSPEALLEALKHLGANAKTLGLPASLWCADFMNLVLRKSGVPATGSRAARSYLQYGHKVDEPRVGAIAIFSRGRNSGHVGIVRGTDGNGNPIIVSGNHNHKVAEATYPKSRVIAYVVPK